MDNYRPISVLPVASKLLERAVHQQLYQYLTEHQLLSAYQCGFRKNHSTESAAISFTDSIRRGMDQGLLTGSVFIDLRKAFDTVDHYILLRKLGNYGIYDRELAWFANYLKDRSQVVCYGNELSNPCSIISGVPQGSILGPLLFILFINDLPCTIKQCSVLMYADDTVLYYAARNVADIERVLNKELKLLNDWLVNNGLFLHRQKMECVLFGSSPRFLSSVIFSYRILSFS